MLDQRSKNTAISEKSLILSSRLMEGRNCIAAGA